jgi:hypothetical protein
VKADDDFGIKQVQMFYSVNGAPRNHQPVQRPEDASGSERQPHAALKR